MFPGAEAQALSFRSEAYEDALQQDVQELHCSRRHTARLFVLLSPDNAGHREYYRCFQDRCGAQECRCCMHNAADMYSGAPNHSYDLTQQ